MVLSWLLACAEDGALETVSGAGVTTAVVTDATRLDADGGARTFRVEVWYPATTRADATDILRLDDEAPAELVAQLPSDYPFPSWVQPAERDAPPNGAGGTAPVVLFSHGNAAVRWQSFSLATALARAGYLVVSPDHPGNTLYDQLGLESTLEAAAEAAVNRPLDVFAALDRLTEGTLTGGDVDALADLGRVGVAGHSFGAWTAMIASTDLALLSDPRISVTVALAPPVTSLEAFALTTADLRGPVLFAVGDLDWTTPLATEAEPGYAAAEAPKGLLVLEDVGHLGFTDLCDDALVALAVELGYPDDLVAGLSDGCGEGYADPGWVTNQTARATTAWLDRFLRDELAAERALSPAAWGDGASLTVAL